MTRQLIRIVALLFTVVACAIFFPKQYRKLVKTGFDNRKVLYSEIINDFIITDQTIDLSKKKGSKSVSRDTKGTIYNSDQLDSVLVLDNASKLAFNDELPDSLCGMAITPELLAAKSCTLYFGSQGGDDYGILEIRDKMLYVSGKYELQELFRFREHGMEFIDSKTNTINQERSAAFTKALTDNGFVFPSLKRWISSERIESQTIGYFMNDAAGKFFRVAMNEGAPEIEVMAQPDGKTVRNMKFSSHSDFLAIVVTEDGGLYIMNRDFSYVQLPIPSILDKNVVLSSNLLYKTFSLSSEQQSEYYVTDTLYNRVDSMVVAHDNSKAEMARTIEQVLFPVVIRVGSYGGMNFSFSSPLLFIWVNLACVVLFVFLRRRKQSLGGVFAVTDIAMVALLGIFGLLAQLAIPQIKQRKN